jgi:predicted DNA-binding protein with PD1-like motif
MGDVEWKGPEPYVHIHLALSGGPYRAQEVNVGHLSGGTVKGLFAEVFEFL